MGLNKCHVKILYERYAISHSRAKGLESKGLLKSLTVEEVNEMLKRTDIESGGLYIGYPNSDAFNIRLDTELVTKEGKKIRYLRPQGQGNCLYIPDGLDLDKESELWITEGELKAESSYIRGLPVVALSGIYGWKGNRSNPLAHMNKVLKFTGKSSASDSLSLIPDLNQPWQGKSFVLIYDSDITRKHIAWEAFPRLAEQLHLLDAKSVKIISCPTFKEEKSGKKIGLDDLFVTAQSADTFTDQDIIDSLKNFVATTPEYIPLGDGSKQYVKSIRTNLEATDKEKLNAAVSILYLEGETEMEEYVENLGKGYGHFKKKAKAELKDVLERQLRGVPEKVTLSELKHYIQEAQTLHKNKKSHSEIDKDEIYNLTINSLKAAGKFFLSPETQESWYFCRDSKKAMNLQDNDFQSFFTEVTGASIKSDYGKSVLSKINAHIRIKGEKQSVYRLSHFNKEGLILYLDLYNGEMLRLDGSTPIKTVPNGTEDVFFASESFPEWKFVETKKEDLDLFLKTILGGRYSPSSKLSPGFAKIVDLVWKLSLFFPEIHPTRGILLYLGEKGSGKSNSARVYLKTLFGDTAEVSSVLKSNQDQIIVLLTNRPVICLDNLDSSVSSFLDTLATAATGGKIPRRILYTTNEIGEYPIISWIMITARTPKLYRDDIAERLLTLHLDKLDIYIPEGKLMEIVRTNRDKFRSIIALMLNEVIQNMKRSPSWRNEKEQFRLADYASFMRLFLTTAVGQKGGEITDDILEALTSSQQQFFIEEDPLIQIILKLLDQKVLLEDKGYKLQEIIDQINQAAVESYSTFRINSPRSLTFMMNERKRAAEKIYSILITEGRTGGYKTYRFKRN